MDKSLSKLEKKYEDIKERQVNKRKYEYITQQAVITSASTAG